MSRLVDADHYVGNTLTNSFVEKDISYDKNTNLLTLKRYNNGTLTDDLSFSYLGNRRVGYNCDLNGNITNDATENLQVSYNFLNLPTAISQNSEVKARYSYAADSTKLGVVDASGVGYDYRGSFKYIRNGSSIELESVASSGGRTYKTDSGYEVRYFITDHLGSVRAVVNADGEIVEQNDYMPYGTLHANAALQKTDNRYLYGGKELQTDFGVNYYDSFARFQRTDGAFNSIDPLAEKFYGPSPYAYCAGNPIVLQDPNGKFPIIPILWWVLCEGGLAIYDGYTTYQTLSDENATTFDKATAVGGVLASAVLPGGGYTTVSKADDVAKIIIRNSDNIATHSPKVAQTIKQAKGGALRRKMKLTSGDAHHIIPVKLLNDNTFVQDAVEAGFDFNGLVNGVQAPRYHGPHLNYTNTIKQEIQEYIKDNPNYSPDQAKTFLEELADKMRKEYNDYK